MNTVCISTKISTTEKVGGTKHRVSPPLQKVGGHIPLSTHGPTPTRIVQFHYASSFLPQYSGTYENLVLRKMT